MNKLDASKQKHLLKAQKAASTSAVSMTSSLKLPPSRGGRGTTRGGATSAPSTRLKATSPTGSHHGSRGTSTSSEDDVVPAGRGSGDGSTRYAPRGLDYLNCDVWCPKHKPRCAPNVSRSHQAQACGDFQQVHKRVYSLQVTSSTHSHMRPCAYVLPHTNRSSLCGWKYPWEG